MTYVHVHPVVRCLLAGTRIGLFASLCANGSGTQLIGTGPAIGPIQPTGAIDILCNGTSNQVSAWVQQLSFLAGGVRPSGM
jgi:hypothetical protein